MKILPVLVIILVFVNISNAQYKTYKDNYDVKTYEYQEGDLYNPTIVGTCAIFPGAGHFYAQQPGRGFLFLGGTILSGYLISDVLFIDFVNRLIMRYIY